jgi:Tudor domain
VSDLDCSVYFLDYGNSMTTSFEDIWKMPKQLVKNCVSRTVYVKLKSGRSIQDIDVDETKEKLAYLENFEADIGKIGEKKFSITIDDSLVIFKK